MKNDVEELIKTYLRRINALSVEILKLQTKAKPNEEELRDLENQKIYRIFWQTVVQDLRKIVDKS